MLQEEILLFKFGNEKKNIVGDTIKMFKKKRKIKKISEKF